MGNIGHFDSGRPKPQDTSVKPDVSEAEPQAQPALPAPKPQKLPAEDSFARDNTFVAEPGDSTTTHVLNNAFTPEPGEETGVRLLGKNLSALPSLSQEAQSFLAKGFESSTSEPSSLAEMQAQAPALIAEFEIHQKEAMRIVDHFGFNLKYFELILTDLMHF